MKAFICTVTSVKVLICNRLNADINTRCCPFRMRKDIFKIKSTKESAGNVAIFTAWWNNWNCASRFKSDFPAFSQGLLDWDVEPSKCCAELIQHNTFAIRQRLSKHRSSPTSSRGSWKKKRDLFHFECYCDLGNLWQHEIQPALHNSDGMNSAHSCLPPCSFKFVYVNVSSVCTLQKQLQWHHYHSLSFYKIFAP